MSLHVSLLRAHVHTPDTRPTGRVSVGADTVGSTVYPRFTAKLQWALLETRTRKSFQPLRQLHHCSHEYCHVTWIILRLSFSSREDLRWKVF